MRAFGAVPKRGAETGGLLFGYTAENLVVIDGFETVPCDYRLGPSYVFPPGDWNRWQEAITRAQAKGLEVVGYFRSDTRERSSFAPEDLALLDHFLPGAGIAALLIRPFATRVSQAGFFFRGPGGVFPSSTPLEFPFSRKALGGGKRRADAGEANSATVTAEDHPPVSPTPAIDPAPRQGASRGTWAAALGLSVALGWSGGFFTARRLPQLPEPNQYRLGLSASPRGTELRIAWDTDAEPLRTATRGQLRVREGTLERTIALDLELLRQGLVVYQSPPGPVHFDLEVEQIAGTVLRESVDYRPR